MATARQAQTTFIVSVDPIKKQIQNVKKKLVALREKDPDAARAVNTQLRILKKVWDDLGNLTF